MTPEQATLIIETLLDIRDRLDTQNRQIYLLLPNEARLKLIDRFLSSRHRPEEQDKIKAAKERRY